MSVGMTTKEEPMGASWLYIGMSGGQYLYQCSCGITNFFDNKIAFIGDAYRMSGWGPAICQGCRKTVVSFVAFNSADAYAKWRSNEAIEAAIKKLKGHPTFSPVESKLPENHPKAGQPTSCLFHIKGIPQKTPVIIYGPCDEDVP